MRWPRFWRPRSRFECREVDDTGDLPLVQDAASLMHDLVPLITRLEGHSMALQGEVDHLKRLTEPAARHKGRNGNGHTR